MPTLAGQEDWDDWGQEGDWIDDWEERQRGRGARSKANSETPRGSCKAALGGRVRVRVRETPGIPFYN